MTKKQDYLPEAERHKPATPEDALLAFGELGDPEFPLYQKPTGSAPGSAERIEIYRQRVARREPLFNPHDRNDWHGAGVRDKRTANPITQILKRLEQRDDR